MWADTATGNDLVHGCGYVDANEYVHARDVILKVNASANFRSIFQTSTISGCWQSIGALESGSANGDGHEHDCGRGSWPILAEHRMKPCSGSVYLVEP